MTNTKKIKLADFIGITSASVCMVHCVATPLLITLGVGFFTEPIIKYLFLFIAFISIYKATENLNSPKLIFFLWASFGGFLLSTVLHEHHEFFEYAGYLFSILVILAHILNIQHYKKYKNEIA